MLSETTLVSEMVPVQYRSGDREFRLVFTVSIGVALSKMNRTAILSFIGEPMLQINLDDLEEKFVFYLYLYVSL